jgi:hypothetical protein
VPPPLRSWSLGRRSGRVATAPDPPLRPSSIVALRDGRGNDIAGRDQTADRLAARAALLLSRAAPSLRSRSAKIVRSRPASLSAGVTVENSGNREKSIEYLRNLTEFAARPMGTNVNPVAMIAARAVGMSVEEIHRRAYAGELPPSKPIDPGVLLSRRTIYSSERSWPIPFPAARARPRPAPRSGGSLDG